MPNLLDPTAEIVMSHASSTQMTSDQLLEELRKVHALLQKLEGGISPAQEETKPVLSPKQAFKKDEVVCMVCGKGGMKSLTRHIKQAHDLEPGPYKKQFNVPGSQKLAARSFSEARKKIAEERGLGAKAKAAPRARKAAPKKSV